MIEIRKTIILRPRRRLSSRARIGAFSTRSNASSRREHRTRVSRAKGEHQIGFLLIDSGTPRLIDSGGANGGFPPPEPFGLASRNDRIGAKPVHLSAWNCHKPAVPSAAV